MCVWELRILHNEEGKWQLEEKRKKKENKGENMEYRKWWGNWGEINEIIFIYRINDFKTKPL